MASHKKIALITGGSRGLGRNMALRVAEKGIDVVITYHSRKDEADAVIKAIEEKGGKAAALQLEAGNIKGFPDFFQRLKTVLKDTFQTDHFDFLVNNAGIALYKPFAETTEEEFDAVMNIHYKGVFFLTQQALALLNDGGRIINISSGLARFSYPGSSAYGSMKSAVDTLTRYLAKELGPRGIGVNVVAPGAIETDFGGGHVRDTPEVNKTIAAATALGRVGLPEDIGGVVAFLLTEDGRWINGQRIEVSGGIHL